jgi:hypothetical protein
MSPALHFVYDDGGRKAAGFKGTTGDCVCRAIAIATQRPYTEVYNELNEVSKKERVPRRARSRSSARTGMHKKTTRAYLTELGWKWTPTMFIGQGTKVHLKAGELPNKPLIVQLSKHMVAVIYGAIHDLSNPSRGGTRCVYGYWSKP